MRRCTEVSRRRSVISTSYPRWNDVTGEKLPVGSLSASSAGSRAARPPATLSRGLMGEIGTRQLPIPSSFTAIREPVASPTEPPNTEMPQFEITV